MCWGQQFFRGRRETVAVCVESSRLGVSIAGTWHCAKNCLSFPFWWVVPSGIFAFSRELQHISSAVALTLFSLCGPIQNCLYSILGPWMHKANEHFEFLSTAAVSSKRWAKYNLWLYPLSLSISDTLSTSVAQAVRKEMDFISGEEWPTLSLLGLVFLSFSRGTKAFLSVAEFAHHFQILLLLLLSLSRHRCELPRFSLPCVGCIFFYHGEARLGSILNTTG